MIVLEAAYHSSKFLGGICALTTCLIDLRNWQLLLWRKILCHKAFRSVRYKECRVYFRCLNDRRAWENFWEAHARIPDQTHGETVL